MIRASRNTLIMKLQHMWIVLVIVIQRQIRHFTHFHCALHIDWCDNHMADSPGLLQECIASQSPCCDVHGAT